MQLLQEFFQALAQMVSDWLGCLVEHLLRDDSYRQGFGGAIVLLIVVFGLASGVPWASGRLVAYVTAWPPNLRPGPSSEEGTRGCLGGLLLLGLLTFLLLGLLWGMVTAA